MEDQPLKTADSTWSDDIARTLDEQRQRARTYVATQRERFEKIEGRLTDQVDRIAEQVALARIQYDDSLEHAKQEAGGLQLRAAELDAQDALLADLQRELNQRQNESADLTDQYWAITEEQQALKEQREQVQQRAEDYDALQSDFHHQQEELRQAQEQFAQQQDDLNRREQVFADQKRQLSEEGLIIEEEKKRLDKGQVDAHAQREEIERHITQLDERRAEMDAREIETNEQRNRIAQKLKACRNAQWAEIDERQAKLERQASSEDNRLQQQLLEMTTQQDSLQQELNQHHTRLDELTSERDQLVINLDAQATETDKATAKLVRTTSERDKTKAEFESQIASSRVALFETRADCETMRHQMAQTHIELDERTAEADELRCQLDEVRSQTADPQQIKALIEERKQLNTLLQDAERRLEEQTSDAGEQANQDLQRRYELAMDDLRSIKNENEELKQQMEQLGDGSKLMASVRPVGGWDWEAQKQQLLAQLEGVTGNGPQQAEEIVKAEDTIRVTEGIVSEKERQIAELQQQLREQQEQDDVAVGATTIAKMLDQNELIRQERDNLQKVQKEWRDKLRQAEVDISVERAKIARERSGLEEKLSMFEAERTKHEARRGDGVSSRRKQQRPSSRWLEKLGLGGNDDE